MQKLLSQQKGNKNQINNPTTKRKISTLKKPRAVKSIPKITHSLKTNTKCFSTTIPAPIGDQPENIKLRPDVRTTFANAISDDLLVSLSMNFNNSGRSHQELCDNLRKNNLISTPAIEYAFRKSDRKFFDPSMHPYEDKPHDIGGGATITAAHMHAIALESLGDALVPLKTTNVQIPPKTFVDVGSGSGFVTSVMGHIIHLLRLSPKHSINARKSRVIGIEIHEGLLKQSIENIRTSLPEMVNDSHPVDAFAKIDNVLNDNDNDHDVPIANLISLDAFSTKSKLPHGPFDAIHCGVAIDFVPLSLLAQLKPGGRLVVPIKLAHSDEQDLLLFTRKHIVDGADITNTDTDLFDKACKIQQNGDRAQIEEFLNTFFTSKQILRCVYMMAHTDKTVPNNIPAINTSQKQATNEALSRFFAGGNNEANMSPEERATAQAQLKKQQLFEKEAKTLKFQEELDQKRLELETTSEEIKKWHTNYVQTNDGKKPTLKEMQSDRVLNNMLIIVKELRTKIARLERAIIALQSENENGKKH